MLNFLTSRLDSLYQQPFERRQARLLGHLAVLAAGPLLVFISTYSVPLAAAVGTLVGVVSAYSGGWVDDGLMRLTEFFQVLPRFFLAVIVIAFFGAGIEKVILVLGLTSWTMLARIVRSEVLSIKERGFVEVSRAQGAPDPLVMRRHVLPHAIPALVVTASLLAGQAILIEAGLSFLGLGDPSAVSWGYMLNNARSFLRVAWWTAVFPGLAITLATLGVNLAGDGVNDAWNPRRGRR